MKTNYLILFLIFTHPVLSSSINEMVKSGDPFVTDILEIESIKDKQANNKQQLIISYIESNRYNHYFDIDYDVTYNYTVPEFDESIDPELLEHINKLKLRMHELYKTLGEALISKSRSKLYFKRKILKNVRNVILAGCGYWLVLQFLLAVGLHYLPKASTRPVPCFSYAYKVVLGFLIGLLVDTLGRFIFLYNSVKTYL